MGTNMPYGVLFSNSSLATQNSKMVAIFFKIADFSDKNIIKFDRNGVSNHHSAGDGELEIKRKGE
jgi:hypothetical protein